MEMNAKEVMSIIMERYTLQILMGTSEKPKGIRELSREYNIPVTMCYRRVKSLVGKGLLSEEKEGKRVKYISNMENFRAILNFEENTMHVILKNGDDTLEKKSTIL